MRESAVIEARDVDNIYAVPEAYHGRGARRRGAGRVRHRAAASPPIWSAGALINERVRNPEGEVTIAIVGKYTGMKDAYKSLIEALSHGGIANKVKVNLDWIEVEVFENEDPAPFLEHVNGILVPGGFGQRGAEGKIRAAQFARERHVPYFGICFGMQMAVIEAARNLCGIERRQLHRVRPDARAGGRPDDRMAARAMSWRSARQAGDLGGTMRLGAYPAVLTRGSRVSRDLWRRPRFPSATATATRSIPTTRSRWSSAACVFPACRPTACCRRSSNIEDHPWFIGVQFHPELKSRPFEPHPLFSSFIGAAVEQSRLV